MMHRRLLRGVPAGLLSFVALPTLAQQRPNILYIMCDDMGYGDLSCYGQQHFQTPNIDRLASQGMRMTSAYAGSPVSAPSRACFMTGQHSGHTHVRGNREYWHNSGTVQYGASQDFAVVGQEPYDTAQAIIPEIFKAAGYRTGMFGKWAGGFEGSPSTPDKRGIDEFYGYICQFQAHLYFPNFLNRYSRALGDTCVVREVLEQNIQHAMYGERREQPMLDAVVRITTCVVSTAPTSSITAHSSGCGSRMPPTHSLVFSPTPFPTQNCGSPMTRCCNPSVGGCCLSANIAATAPHATTPRQRPTPSSLR